MNKKIIERYNKLINLVEYHRNLYHIYDRQEISDEALDSLKKEIFDIEKKFPNILRKDSPSQRVGGKPLDKFKKASHHIKQYSLEDAFDKVDLENFEKRAYNILKKENIDEVFSYLVELKIDGLKIILEYQEGFLIKALTRGDGVMGEDVTENIKRIESIPLKLKENINIIIVGEIWMSKKEFTRINKENEKLGLVKYANQRNIASGTIRQLNPEIVAQRRLSVFFYEIAKSNIHFNNNLEKLKYLEKLGLPINQFFKKCQNIDEVFDWKKEIAQKREGMNYLIDGLVLKIFQTKFEKILGYTGKAPRFAIALKFPAQQKTTIIKNVIFQVGRSGAITPVALLKAVSISGSIVERATLHNFFEIERLDVRIGDTVVLEKSGDIIPKVIRVLKELRPINAKKILPPKKLAICGGQGDVIKDKDALIYKCRNKNSSEIIIAKINHFVSKKCFNIEGFGYKIVEKIFLEKKIKNYSDVFYLEKKDLIKIDGLGEKSANNLIREIDNAKKVTLAKFLFSLSIEGVGEIYANLLSKQFSNLENLQKAQLEKLLNINGLGEILAHNIYNWFQNKTNLKFLNRILKKITIINLKQSRKLKNQFFVITGTLDNYSRLEMSDLITENGGNVSESISAKTNFLIIGRGGGEKKKKAQKNSIKIISEKDFLNLLK